MEDRISDLGDRNIEMLQVEEERELRSVKNEIIPQKVSDSIRKSNIRITGIPEEEEKANEAESLFKEIIAKNFPNLGKELELQVKEVNRTPHYINVKRPSLRYILATLAKVNDKEKIFRAEENNLQGNPYQGFSGFLSRNITG